MAKEDFCFTYYDGDAARDKAHMTRLERGAYDDLISAQRKRGHLTIDDIKKVLSKDFDTCWSSLEWILLKDDQGKFFIEWVDKSVEKMRKNSEKQKENINKRWNKNDTVVLPTNEIGKALVIPLEDVNVNGYEKENINKIVLPKNGFFLDELDKSILLTELQIENTKTFFHHTLKKELSTTDISDRWEAFKANNLSIHKWENGIEDLIKHFRNSLKYDLQNGITANNNATGKLGTSAARMEAARKW